MAAPKEVSIAAREMAAHLVAHQARIVQLESQLTAETADTRETLAVYATELTENDGKGERVRNWNDEKVREVAELVTRGREHGREHTVLREAVK